ncbi:putative glycoside hydrolase [Methanobrevibacter sp. UBA212]|uniref:putative glycoside hydrolase n=1 Tax=Methanobrevibacter sp. UBA212 TaxID=1915476 RepID=UPI0025CC8095|nr:Ig-like domain repeat protein [Methanobrevibacter sp. UBA212]
MEGEKISIKNKALILSIALVLFFVMGAAGAVNQTDVDVAQQADAQDAVALDSEADGQVNEASQSPEIEDSPQVQTTIKSDDKNIVKGHEFSVTLSDNNSSPIANKSVAFTFNKVVSNATTDENGVAKLKINSNPGEYTVKYSFSGEGYMDCENSTRIQVIASSVSKIKAPSYTAYIGVTNTYTVTLTAGDTPLANRPVTFKLNGKTYSKKTNSKGQASININLAKGSYTLSYSYKGEQNINPVSGTSKITVKKGMPTKMVRADSEIYRNKKTSYFKIKLTDSRGTPLKSKKVILTLKGKKYTKKTNANGIASLKIKLKIGKYNIKASFSKTNVYNKASKTFKITVKPVVPTNNGMWLFGRDMKSVNLKTLQNNGFKHVFLNFKAVELYGKSGVEEWVKTAKSYGVKVHLWMQVFYGAGNWQNPVKNGKINYDLINSKVDEAKGYAKIKGIAGVHFDYVRYPGNAHNYPNSVKAINTFIKKATNAVHSINKKLIVSAAVMPEPSGMKYYYGQDIKTMGKYLDAILPMVYKGNYHAGTKWIKSVTKTFEKQSKKAKIWTGLQTYRSDASLKKIPAKELMGDVRAAVNGGANGVILFRYGLYSNINFKAI